MVTIIVVGIICLLLGFLISNFIKKTKIKEKNQEVEKEEQQAQLRIKDLEKQYLEKEKQLEKDYYQKSEILQEQNNILATKQLDIRNQIEIDKNNWEQEKNKKLLDWSQQESILKAKVSSLEGQIEEKKKSINELDQQAKVAIGLVEEQVLNNMSENISIQNENLQKAYEKLGNELRVRYTELTDDLWDSYSTIDEKLSNEILIKENMLNELQAKTKAAIEANKRMELDRQQKNFYRLQLSNIDLEEIKRIRSIEPYLRKKEPLNKVIWKVYYEKPYTDLIGRVIGQGAHTGIYKITNMENGMSYIGQSTNIAERWKQHIKRGIGADPPTQNKLYPAMQAIGVENFTFEIIEECASNLLNSREDYWQTFYQAKEFGYSIK